MRGDRYDFMSDMAFGGGTELIEAGHDEGNVWALLDEAMLYVLSLSSYLSGITRLFILMPLNFLL